MTKYKVNVTHTIEYCIEVEADNEVEAENKTNLKLIDNEDLTKFIVEEDFIINEAEEQEEI